MLYINLRLSCVPSIIPKPTHITQGSVPFWPSALAAMTGYSESSSPIFAAALQHGDRLAQKLFVGPPDQHAVVQPGFM